MEFHVQDGVIKVYIPFVDVALFITLEVCVITLAVYAAEWLVRH